MLMTKIYIDNPKHKEGMLVINNCDWQQALREMKQSEFALYLLLASVSKESIEISPKLFEESTGFQKSAYYDAINKLKTLGYLIEQGWSRLSFFTAPIRDNGKLESVKRYFGDVPMH